MGQFDTLIGKFILAGLIFLGIFSFIIAVQSDNNAVQPAIENEVFNESFSGLSKQIDKSNSEAEEKYDVFNTEDPSAGFGSIVLFGVVSVGRTFSNITFSLFGAIIRLPLVVLGVDPDIYNLLLTWLIIVVIVSVWLLYKYGG